MKGKAPKGFYTQVDVVVTLKGGRGRMYRRQWDTPMALAPAYHKALKWVAADLTELAVKNRSQIRRVQVSVRYVEGEYVHETDATG